MPENDSFSRKGCIRELCQIKDRRLMNWQEVLVTLAMTKALKGSARKPEDDAHIVPVDPQKHPSGNTPTGSTMLTLIKRTKEGEKTMSGKSVKIDSTEVKVDSFEATDKGENIHFSITRSADGNASTKALVTLFGKPSAVSVVDNDSNTVEGKDPVTFTLSDGQISEYRYFTREGAAALEYFKLEGKIGA